MEAPPHTGRALRRSPRTGRTSRTTPRCRAATGPARSASTTSTRARPDAEPRGLPARRAVVGLPLPQDGARAHGGRAARGRPRPRRLRPVGQAGRPRRLHVPAPRRLDGRAGSRRVDLRDATLVGQDWGGLIGLRLVAEHPDRFDRRRRRQHVPADGRPTGRRSLPARGGSTARRRPTFNVGRIVQGGCATRPLPPDVVAAYDAPFPDDRYKAGARQFPVLVPISPDDPAAPAEPPGVGGARPVGEADAVRVQRRRSDHRRRRPRLPAAGARHAGHAAHDHRRRRPLPPGGPGRGAGRGRGRLSVPGATPWPGSVAHVPRGGPVPSFGVSAQPQRVRTSPTTSRTCRPSTIDLVVTKVPLGDAANGLCGGMAYAVRDLFVARRLPDPAQADAPGSGPLFDYLVDRLIDSWKARRPPDARRCRLLPADELDGARPGGLWTRFSPGTVPGLGDGEERVAGGAGGHRRGPPSPLGLIRVLTWDPTHMGHHHQVLVWGYTLDGLAARAGPVRPERPRRGRRHPAAGHRQPRGTRSR